MDSRAQKPPLPLWWSSFFKSISHFVACAFGVVSNKLLPNLRSWNFTTIFASKHLICSAFASRSLDFFFPVDFCVKFCICCEVGVQLYSFAVHFKKKTMLLYYDAWPGLLSLFNISLQMISYYLMVWLEWVKLVLSNIWGYVLSWYYYYYIVFGTI